MEASILNYNNFNTGNFRQNFIFASSVKKDMFAMPINSPLFISRRQSNFAISRGFYFHETETFLKISEFTVCSEIFTERVLFLRPTKESMTPHLVQ